jgi:hypothetical protein
MSSVIGVDLGHFAADFLTADFFAAAWVVT